MVKYRRKPTVINAVQWTGDNEKEIRDFARSSANITYYVVFGNACGVTREKPSKEHTVHVSIDTPAGPEDVHTGDYIIRDIDGFYVCSEEIFNKTYERI